MAKQTKTARRVLNGARYASGQQAAITAIQAGDAVKTHAKAKQRGGEYLRGFLDVIASGWRP